MAFIVHVREIALEDISVDISFGDGLLSNPNAKSIPIWAILLVSVILARRAQEILSGDQRDLTKHKNMRYGIGVCIDC